jgi:hypothetical protein
VRLVNDLNEVIEEVYMHGKVMGKEVIKHVRFYHSETKTQYIRWNAPEKLRVFIADKDPNQVVYIKAEREYKKKDKLTGKEEFVPHTKKKQKLE